MTHPGGPGEFEATALNLYASVDAGIFVKPEYDVFYYALTGYDKLKKDGKLPEQDIITLIDFRKPSTEKRLWVIDLNSKRVLFHSLVAHGRNSGELYARSFSNKIDSHQSSLGFYVTGSKYMGKHGLSLILRGLENGINDQSERRAIVMHGADYVSDAYAKKYGRLGRSFGCPALPSDLYKQIINTVAGGSCLFIYYPDQGYLRSTELYSYLAKSTSVTGQ
jgi:hypothetical protein